MRVAASPESVDFVRGGGGALWVWAARPARCCGGAPAYMHASTEPPPGSLSFSRIPHPDIELWFRAPGGRLPEVLEIGMHGRRRPRIEAYWDGCLMAL
jgi:hypothetical protein